MMQITRRLATTAFVIAALVAFGAVAYAAYQEAEESAPEPAVP